MEAALSLPMQKDSHNFFASREWNCKSVVASCPEQEIINFVSR